MNINVMNVNINLSNLEGSLKDLIRVKNPVLNAAPLALERWCQRPLWASI